MRGVESFENYLNQARDRYKAEGADFIYSLFHVREFIFKILETAKCRSVCEIGSQGGLFTQELHRLYREGVIDRLTVIDPFPTQSVLAMADGKGCVVVAGYSLEVLDTLDSHDAYIVDGDHNYFTVKNELEKIFIRRNPIAILHDIAWPCGTRDMYYDPKTIPLSSRRPYTFDVVLDPANDGIAEAGEISGGKYAVALFDGGEKNGVFPAIRDVAASLDLDFDGLPALLGVGLLRHSDHSFTRELSSLFPTPEIEAILWRLEENRISNWVASKRAEASSGNR